MSPHRDERAYRTDMPATDDVEHLPKPRQRGRRLSFELEPPDCSARSLSPPIRDGSSTPSIYFDDDRGERKIGWKQRIRHFTWTWFTMSMVSLPCIVDRRDDGLERSQHILS